MTFEAVALSHVLFAQSWSGTVPTVSRPDGETKATLQVRARVVPNVAPIGWGVETMKVSIRVQVDRRCE